MINESVEEVVVKATGQRENRVAAAALPMTAAATGRVADEEDERAPSAKIAAMRKGEETLTLQMVVTVRISTRRAGEPTTRPQQRADAGWTVLTLADTGAEICLIDRREVTSRELPTYPLEADHPQQLLGFQQDGADEAAITLSRVVYLWVAIGGVNEFEQAFFVVDYSTTALPGLILGFNFITRYNLGINPVAGKYQLTEAPNTELWRELRTPEGRARMYAMMTIAAGAPVNVAVAVNEGRAAGADNWLYHASAASAGNREPAEKRQAP